MIPKILIILAASAGLAGAQINVAFHNGATTVNAMTTRPDGTVVATSANTWNNPGNAGLQTLVFSNFPLKNNAGAATSALLDVSAGFSSYNNNGWGTNTQDHVMMEGWYGFIGAEFIRVRNLPAAYVSSGYSVIIYGDSNVASRTMGYTVDDVTTTVTRTILDSGLFSGTFTENTNFVTVTGLSGPTLTIKGNATGTRTSVNGFIILPGTLPVPPKIAAFTAVDQYVSPGTSVNLTWSVARAESLILNPGNLNVTGQTTTPVVANATTTYTLTATNADGSTSKALRIGAGPPRPNVLFFLVDDMGWQDTSEPFYYNAQGQEIVTALNQRYRTPGMEALADQGLKFTRAYAHPVCTPTRVTLMTGKNAARHHVTNWTNLDGSETTQNHIPNLRSPVNWERTGISPSENPLPKILAAAGYRTIHAGKAHFGSRGAIGQYPTGIGFDVNIAGNEIGNPGSYIGDYGQSGDHAVPGLSEYQNTGTFLTEALTLEMNKAISGAVADGVPFFAYMAHYAVHSPFNQDPRFAANYPGLSGGALAYATLIEGMDQSLRDITAKLQQLGVAEDTLIIFLSDNGGDAPISDGNAPLRGKKAMSYEGGVRVPMIVGWAAANGSNSFQQAIPITPGTRQDDMVHISDMFPTVLSVAGLPIPQPIDGFDLKPYFAGDANYHRPQRIITHYPHSHNGDYYSLYHEDHWKLIYNYADESYELYDLAADIGETNNLAAAQPERVMAMSRKLFREFQGMGAQFPQNVSRGAPQSPITPLNYVLDLDHDGIPDIVEDPNRNGLIDAGETDPDNDNTDGDGTPDGVEIRAGTDPLDSSSFFFGKLSHQADSWSVTWPSKPGAIYRIDSSTSMSSNEWVPVADDISASAGTETSYPLEGPGVGGGSSRKFYRIGIK